MSRQDHKKNKLDYFHKVQLENHRAIFAGVEPIVTRDGKQNDNDMVEPKKKNKIRSLIAKLFGRIKKRGSGEENIAISGNTKQNQNNDIASVDSLEERIKQMNSKEIIELLNTDEIKLSESRIGVNKQDKEDKIEEQIKNMDSVGILQFLNTDNLSRKETTKKMKVAEPHDKGATGNNERKSWVSSIKQDSSNNQGRNI